MATGCREGGNWLGLNLIANKEMVYYRHAGVYCGIAAARKDYYFLNNLNVV